jgi:hypothetical protein
LKALKVFEKLEFERGIDPKDSMRIGDVQGRLLKARRAEALEAMEEILNTYGGDGPFLFDEDTPNGLNPDSGFKIGIYQEGPIQSRFKIVGGGNEIRYYIEYAYGKLKGEEAFFAGWEQEDTDGKWKDRQWTSKLPGTGESIKTIEQAKQILIDYIKTNKQQ